MIVLRILEPYRLLGRENTRDSAETNLPELILFARAMVESHDERVKG